MSMFQRPRNPAARLSAKARRSQSWWKTGSFGSGSTGPKPCMPPRSWMPFIVIGSPRTAGPQPREISMVALPSPRRLHLGDADHRVARDEIRQLLLGHAFRALRALGQHEIAQLGRAVPHAHLDVVADVHAELAQHAARVDHRAGARRARPVPHGPPPEHGPRTAGAERAHDHVVDLRRVLEHDHVLALAADLA